MPTAVAPALIEKSKETSNAKAIRRCRSLSPARSSSDARTAALCGKQTPRTKARRGQFSVGMTLTSRGAAGTLEDETMQWLIAIPAPVLVVGALFAKARQSALGREAKAAQEAADELTRAQITQQGQVYRIVVNIDAARHPRISAGTHHFRPEGLTQHFSSSVK
jgi:hypothetical protein